MGFEQCELPPQSPSKTLTPKPYNIKSLLFGIFIGIFLGIIGNLLVEKRSDCEVFKQNLTICAANNKVLKEEKWVEKKKKMKIEFRLTVDAEHKKAQTLIQRLETEKGTTEAQLVETKKKVVLLESEKNSDKKSSACPVPPSFEGKCRLGWTYLEATDSCYFYHEITYNDEGGS